VAAGELAAGDTLYLADGGRTDIVSVTREKLATPVDVYNVEVADFQTYFVARAGVWVHNCGGQRVTVLGENMRDRVIPYAESTGKSYIPFSTTEEEWANLSRAEQWHLNDGALRARINAGDAFEYIGRDPNRFGARGFDLTGSELLRLGDRGVPYSTVNPGY